MSEARRPPASSSSRTAAPWSRELAAARRRRRSPPSPTAPRPTARCWKTSPPSRRASSPCWSPWRSTRASRLARPVSAYIGAGWSKAAPDQEARIRLIDVLTMSSGLTEGFAYAAPPGTVFLYNTPVYAVTKRVLAAAAKQPLEALTHDWLTGPAGMADTAWRTPRRLRRRRQPHGPGHQPPRHRPVRPDGAGRGSDRRRPPPRLGGGMKAMFAPLGYQPGLWAALVAERQRLCDQPLARRVDGPLIPPPRPTWSRRSARSTASSMSSRAAARRRPHGRRRPRQGLRPAALAPPRPGARLIRGSTAHPREGGDRCLSHA